MRSRPAAAGLRRPCGASSPAACGACVRTRRRSCGRKEAPCASPGGAFGHVGTCEHTRTRGRAHGEEPLASALRPSLRRFAACGPCAVHGPGFESRVADVPPRSEGQAGRPWTELPRFRRFCASWSFPAERCMESAWSQPTISYYLQSKIKNRGDFVHPRSPIRSRGAAGGTVDACGPCAVQRSGSFANRVEGGRGDGNACAVCYTGGMDERREHHNQNGEPFADSFSDGDAGGFERLEDAGEAVAWDDATAAARLEREGRRRPSLDRAMRAFDPEAGAGAAADKLERIKRELDSVPALPGVYLWKDKSGQVIYVGKAKQLRARMRQYVNFQDDRAKIPLLVDQIDSFDYIVVENEHESLVLEKNLINQHSPFFNADFKDDKSYPFIALTKGDAYPAIKYTRERHRPDTKYFGPYTDSRAARDMVDIARRVVPFVRHVVRRMAAHDAQVGTRRQKRVPELRGGAPVLRRARGLGPRRVLRPHHAGGVRRERAAHRAVPVRPAPRVRGRVDRRDAGGGRRARLRARGTHQGAHRHHQRLGRQAARRVHAQPGRRRGGPVPRGDGGGRARVHGARGPHHQLERVRAEPRQGRARRRPAAHVPAALLRRDHVHPARGHPARRARGPRSHGSVAHEQARPASMVRRSA